MAYTIKHRICFYTSQNNSLFYKARSISRQIKNIKMSTIIPHKWNAVFIKNNFKAELEELKPLNYSLNVVLLPNKYRVVHLTTHAQHIILQIGFGRKEKGSYFTFTQRLRHYLKGTPLDVRRKTIFSYGTPQAKLIDIALMLDIVDIKMFSILRKQIKKLNISLRDKQTALKVVSLKQLLLHMSLDISETEKRNNSIVFYRKKYKPINLRLTI